MYITSLLSDEELAKALNASKRAVASSFLCSKFWLRLFFLACSTNCGNISSPVKKRTFFCKCAIEKDDTIISEFQFKGKLGNDAS